MKAIVSIFVILTVLTSVQVFGQVSINTDGSQPDAFAMLDVKSTSKCLASVCDGAIWVLGGALYIIVIIINRYFDKAPASI